LYFHPRVGEAFECHGLILETYREMGEQDSELGYPLTDEVDDPAIAGGRRNDFEGGSLVFDPAVGVSADLPEMAVVPQVVVKITDDVDVPLDRGGALSLAELGAMTGLEPDHFLLQALEALVPNLVARRLFEDLDNAALAEMVAQAQQEDPEYDPPKFANFLVVDCPEEANLDVVAQSIQAIGSLVAFAHPQPVPSDPAVVATANPLFVGQGYLGAAPQGVGVQAIWARGADGSNSRFVDLEQGWLLRHNDLPTGIPLLAGLNRRRSFAHGCAVLGEIVALDNTTGTVGMAPAAQARVISYFERENVAQARLRSTVASRIVVAARSLRFGDVLQLEVQFAAPVAGTDRLVPVETDPACFEAIRLVTHLGIIVVEAAGNGGADLDQFQRNGQFVLRRNTPDFRDSGAIMVGGCTSTVPHQRISFSDFGSRVDCCAWAENVLTTGDPARPEARDGVNPAFNGTSSATPIISSLCLLIQDLQMLLTPKGQAGRLGARSMRQIVSRAGNGTAVPGVGVMPDGAAIVSNEYVV